MLPLIVLMSLSAGPVELEQVVSREHPLLQIERAMLRVGRDGRVYLASNEYVLRIERDGSGKFGGKVTYALTGVAANAAGIVGTANAHFNHSVNLWSPSLAPLGAVSDFLNNDQVEWHSPTDIAAGAADFYGLDANQNRIVRVAPPGRIVAAYPLAATGESYIRAMPRLRIWEPGQRFYVANERGTVHCLDFAGKKLWSLDAGVGGNVWDGFRGAMDVDAAGTLWVVAADTGAVRRFDRDGRPAGEFKLVGGGKGRIEHLAVFENDLVVKRRNPTDLFEVHDPAGNLRRVVRADVEQLRVRLPRDVWNLGEQVTAEIQFDAGGKKIAPRWEKTLVPLVRGAWQPGASRLEAKPYPGLYRFRVAAGEYMVQTVVELRTPGTKGSATAMTPGSRVYYGRGEAAPVTVVFRGKPEDLPKQAALKLIDEHEELIAELPLAVSDKPATVTLPASLTAGLRPGPYLLQPVAARLNCVPQPLVIGPGLAPRPRFHIVQHGDYSAAFNGAVLLWDAPDRVAEHLARSRKLGINLFVDRLGHGASVFDHLFPTGGNGAVMLAELQQRLQADPLSPAPESLRLETPWMQLMAGYGALGIEEQGILLYMDAGLPVGTGFDQRKPEQFAEAIAKVTTAMNGYPAFRGWSWAANWWLGQLGAEAAADPTEKAAYQAALKQAEATGKWDPVLDRVSDRMFAHAVAAERQFNRTLQQVAPGKLSVMTGPYRAVGAYPPVIFQNADEVDLHYQAEQIQPPQVAPHNVDFYKRPGKPAWGHPELWNDDGTGGQVFPTLLQMAMRGADGVGWSGGVPAWGNQPSDPRGTGQGAVSVFRAASGLLNQYGPWLATLEKRDPVAIVVSGRMMRIDAWGQIGGKYFDRLFEAYNACLYAHRPASFVFSEDLKPEGLSRFKAVLVAGQRVELDPPLAAALEKAAAVGVPIYCDRTCRETLVAKFKPLEIAFDRIEKDPSAWQDDAAYDRIPRYFREHAAAIEKALGSAVPPIAGASNPEVMLSESVSGEGRFVWAVNNTMLGLDPGLAWRTSLLASQRLPVIEPVKLGAEGKAVYDVFAMQPAKMTGDTVEADLRTMPARLYAVLPRKIAKVVVRGPKRIKRGQPFDWSATVLDDQGRPVDASVPIRVTLFTSDMQYDSRGFVERFTSARGSQGTAANEMPLILPLNVARRAIEARHGEEPAVLGVTELLSGVTTTIEIPIDNGKAASSAPVAADAEESRRSDSPDGLFLFNETPQKCFGPHIREIAIAPDGSTALLTTANWDENLYCVDLKNGKTLWRRKIGHQFAWGLQVGWHVPERSEGRGSQQVASSSNESYLAAVEGFDYNTAEGYHLYLLGKDGLPQRRFALYGLPKRATNWAGGAQLLDPIDNFAVSPTGDWVAAAGDLGLAVWNADGKLLWSDDGWKTQRRRKRLVALGPQTLVVLETRPSERREPHAEREEHKQTQPHAEREEYGAEREEYGGMTATALRPSDGKKRWELTLGNTGTLLGGEVSADRRTLALRSDALGGRVFIVRDGKLVNTLCTAADAVSLTPDGSALAVTTGRELRWYAADAGLVWCFQGDDVLRSPRVSPDARRVAVGSELGTLYVLRVEGGRIEQDCQALPTAAWLPDGGLVVGTWMGHVQRLDEFLNPQWHTWLQPAERDIRPKLLAKDPTPTSRIESFGNAGEPLPLVPNLLTETQGLITAVCIPPTHGDPRPWQNPIEMLRDGKPEPPPKPWLGWTDINYIDSGWRGPLSLQIDTFRTQLRVTGITMVEDAGHPESWLRDVRVQVWDAAAEQWRDGPMLLSNAATHSHRIEPPLEGAKFRFVSTGGGTWPAANIRLGELVFHGQSLGCSHPDAVARRPQAVLFDEQEADLKCLNYPGRPFAFQYQGAFSGGKCLALTAEGQTGPTWVPPFGHVVPNWDFEIAENPQPGQYRYLQFAWKALSPQTRGISLRVAESHYGGLTFAAGEPSTFEGATVVKQADQPPREWQTVRVDLWALHKKSIRLRSLSLGAIGGGAAFDRIVLERP